MTDNVWPTTFRAGDSFAVTASFTSYDPANNWNYKVAFRGPSALDITAVSDSANGVFYVTGSAATTAVLSEGLYDIVGYVYNNLGERYTVTNVKMTILPDLAADTSERITHAQKVLDVIEAVIEGRITDDVESFSISGRSVTHIPMKELMEMRVVYKRELFKLKKTGQRLSRDIAVHFDPVQG